MRILITNFLFHGRTGSEVATAELATGLVRRGHAVAVYSPLASGRLAVDARRRGVVVIDALSDLPWQPDVIHGHHNIVLAAALLWFPLTPALLVSHHPHFWIEGLLAAPQVKRVYAVSELSRSRLMSEGGLRRDEVGLLLNPVDLDRFALRAALPSRPRRALVLTKNSGHLDVIRKAASEVGLELDELGRGVDVIVDDLHARLPRYDLVFSTGRMALEALASGCAVILVDERGLGGMVTRDVLDAWRSHNLGQHLLQHPVTPDAVGAAIARYDAEDARRVSQHIRRTASLGGYLDEIESVYRQMTSDPSQSGQAWDREAAARLYERVLRHMAAQRHWWQILPAGEAHAGGGSAAPVRDGREAAYEREIELLRMRVAEAETAVQDYQAVIASRSLRVTGLVRRLLRRVIRR